MRDQAMYACNRKIRRGFFAGVCWRENRAVTFRDPPLASLFANGAAPVSPHAQHVDDHNQP
jgi:hypothetical protein